LTRWLVGCGEDVIYLRAKIQTRKAETIPFEGDLQDIIDRRRAAAILKGKDGNTAIRGVCLSSQRRSHADFRKAWASACVSAGLGKMICPKCESEGGRVGLRVLQNRNALQWKSSTTSAALLHAT